MLKRGSELPIRRKLAFTAIVFVMAAAAVGALNVLVGAAERAGWIDTHRADALVSFVESDIFALDPAGEHIVLSDYGNKHMATNFRVPVEKGGAWRLAATGGSLVRGMPYNSSSTGAELPGTMEFWLRARLEEAGDGRGYEVVDAGASGQDAQRVARIVTELLTMDLDVLVLATGNNEGSLPPTEIMSFLHRQPAYRLLTLAVLDEPEPSERPLWVPQDATSVEIVHRFRQSLEAIVAACQQAEVPLVLATVPINLRYTPFPSDPIYGVTPRDLWGPCVWQGAELYRHGHAAEALEQLQTCEDRDAALMWIGTSLYELGRYDEARAVLSQGVELFPLLRTRPSLNAVTREIAASSEGVVLADVAAAVQAASPHGVPGEDLFVDNCHMNWRGYKIMADVILAALDEHGLVPGYDPARLGRTMEQIAREADLPQISEDAIWLEGGRLQAQPGLGEQRVMGR